MNYKQRKARRIKIAKRTKWHSSKKCKNDAHSFNCDELLRELQQSREAEEFRMHDLRRRHIEHVALLDRKAEAKRAARSTNIRLAIYFILLALLVCYVVNG